MTIIPLGSYGLDTSFPAEPPDPSNEAVPETRGFLLAARSDRLHAVAAAQGALYAFATGLGDGERIWLRVQRAGDASRSLTLAAGAELRIDAAAPSDAAGDPRFEDLRQALSLDFPRAETVEIEPGAAEPGQRAFPVRLRGLPINLFDLHGAADADLLAESPRSLLSPRHVAFGACATERPFSEALKLLRSVSGVSGFTLTLRRRTLSAPDLRKLSELYRTLDGLRQSNVLTAAEISRMSEVSALVAAWLAGKAGIELSLALHASLPPGHAITSAFSTLFSLPPSARRDGAAPLLDLSGCFVPGQSFPVLAFGDDVAAILTRSTAEPTADPAGADKAFLGRAGDAPVWLDHAARSRHVLVCGATGTGKSTLLRNLIAADIRAGYPVILIDPHGDLYEDVLALLNHHQDVPVWAADTGDLANPYSLNLLQSGGDIYRQNFACNQLIRLLKTSLYKNVPEGFGPIFESYFRNAFLLLADGGGGAYTISDMDRVFGDAKFRRELLDTCKNEHVSGFWRNIALKAGGDASLENIAPYIVSKLTQFVGNPVINPIVCARESTIDFNEILRSGGSCIVNLAKGRVGATEAELLGGIVTTALFSAALARGGLARVERKPVRIYLDEFQSYAGEVISEMLAECRKYGLELTLATQSLNRLRYMNGDLTQSVLGNTANIVALRSGPDDAGLLSQWIGGAVTRDDIMSLDDFHAVGRFLDRGRVTPPIPFRLEAA